MVIVIIVSAPGCRNYSYSQKQTEIAQEKVRISRFQDRIQAEAKTADCGPYPESYQELTKAAIKALLKDPDSANFQFIDKPVKAK